MANTYFQFKEFTVQQDKAAMKVSTDACIQGAIAAQQWLKSPPGKILDIGSGTGLLSLMLAQSLSKTEITAIDIEPQAYLQTKENFAQSPWTERLKAMHSSLQSFGQERTFDGIICNPPFFHKHLNSLENNRNMARHDEGLSKETLATSISNLLDTSGHCCILYPETEWAAWMIAAQQNDLFPAHIIHIHPYPGKAPNRIIGFFSKKPQAEPTLETFTIYEDTGKNYTTEFIGLMNSYYLHL